MPRLSRNQHIARTRLSSLLASRLPLEALGERVAAILGEAVGWDGYRLFRIDASTHFVNRLLSASDNDAAARLEWLREVHLTMPIPYAELTEMARNGTRSVALQERQDQCWGIDRNRFAEFDARAHYRTYHEYQSPLGGAILSIFRADGNPVAAMQAYRRDAKRPFRGSDIAFMQQVNPLVGQVLAVGIANSLHQQAAAATAMRGPAALLEDGSGVLLIERDGAIRYASPLGQRWLDGLSEAEGAFPTAIWSALAALDQGAASGQAKSVGVTIPLAHGSVRVEASPAGEEGVAAVVIVPVRPATGIEIPASWMLTRQEGQIVRLLATGGSNRELADRLNIGEHTVEWHLRRVYEKAGVRSRQQLVAALFQHTNLRQFDAPLAMS
ncbi:MAG: helix-turn-helix transcriptional regulator [Thermomicrobiales bacterium]